MSGRGLGTSSRDLEEIESTRGRADGDDLSARAVPQTKQDQARHSRVSFSQDAFHGACAPCPPHIPLHFRPLLALNDPKDRGIFQWPRYPPRPKKMSRSMAGECHVSPRRVEPCADHRHTSTSDASFKPSLDSEPAAKRRKLTPSTPANSQPSQSSFADVLQRLKEEAGETKGMSSLHLCVSSCKLILEQKRKVEQTSGPARSLPPLTRSVTALVGRQLPPWRAILTMSP